MNKKEDAVEVMENLIEAYLEAEEEIAVAVSNIGDMHGITLAKLVDFDKDEHVVVLSGETEQGHYVELVMDSKVLIDEMMRNASTFAATYSTNNIDHNKNMMVLFETSLSGEQQHTCACGKCGCK